MTEGQHPKTLFIGCSDSRLVPYLLTGAGPGELFIVRNVGAFVPPYDGSHGLHGTMAAIEFAVLSLKVERIIVCGHSHCGAIRVAYEGAPEEAVALKAWLKLARRGAAAGAAQSGSDMPDRATRRGTATGAPHGLSHGAQRGRGGKPDPARLVLHHRRR